MPSDPTRLGSILEGFDVWAERAVRQRATPDAVARLRYGTTFEWLLVEAKANAQELKSSCQAGDESSLTTIRKTLERTRDALGAPSGSDWLKGYYQFCNRVAVLHGLNTSGAAARLLFVYFCGDVEGPGRTCPSSPEEWAAALAEQDAHVGLPLAHELVQRIHKVFVDVQLGWSERCHREPGGVIVR